MSFHKWGDIEPRTVVPGFHGKFIHSEQMTVSHWDVEQGASLPEHAHHHEQVTMVLEGTFEMTIGGETRRLGPGDVAVIGRNVTHSGTALTPCRITDIFQPIREDYR